MNAKEGYGIIPTGSPRFEDDVNKYLFWQAQIHKRSVQCEPTNLRRKVVYVFVVVESERLVDHEM